MTRPSDEPCCEALPLPADRRGRRCRCCTTRSGPTTPGWSPPRSARTPRHLDPPRGARRCSSACSWACRWPTWPAWTSRADGELAAMLAALAAERAAAGREVPADAIALLTGSAVPREALMRIFDPHIHMTSRTTDDYERMAAAGVRALVEPAFWLGQPRTSAGSFADYFDSLIGWEPFRAGQFGIRHHAHDRAQPQGGQRPALPGGARPAAPLPGQGRRGGGRRGRLRLDDARRGRGVRRPARAGGRRTTCRRWCTPRTGTRRAAPSARLDVVAESGIDPGRVLVDHLNEVTVDAGAGHRLLDGLLHLPGHQDVAAADGGDPARSTARTGCWSTRPPTGAGPTRC